MKIDPRLIAALIMEDPDVINEAGPDGGRHPGRDNAPKLRGGEITGDYEVKAEAQTPNGHLQVIYTTDPNTIMSVCDQTRRWCSSSSRPDLAERYAKRGAWYILKDGRVYLGYDGQWIDPEGRVARELSPLTLKLLQNAGAPGVEPAVEEPTDPSLHDNSDLAELSWDEDGPYHNENPGGH
jgi:hypothetical protein